MEYSPVAEAMRAVVDGLMEVEAVGECEGPVWEDWREKRLDVEDPEGG